MNVPPVRLAIVATVTGSFVVLLVATADRVHLLHATLLLALGVSASLRRPRTG